MLLNNSLIEKVKDISLIENVIIFANIKSKFSLNVIKVLRSIAPDSHLFIISDEEPDFIIPQNTYFMKFEEFKYSPSLKKALDTQNSLAIAIHATKYGIELDMFDNIKKIVIFTGDDTLFRRSSNKILADRFNNLFDTVDAIGFCSFFHQQEYIPFLKSPVLLVPFGYQEKGKLPPLIDKIKKEEILQNYNLNNGNYNIAVILPNNLVSVVSKIKELENYLSEFSANNYINYNILCKKDELPVLEKLLSEVDISIQLFCDEEIIEIENLLHITDMTISFKEIYSVEDTFNIFLQKNHPILSYFAREYSDFENMDSHVVNFESIEGLAKKTVSILSKIDNFQNLVNDGYLAYMQKHTFEKLQEKLKVRIEQIFNNELHPNHEDTDFVIDDDKPMIIFTHFAKIEGHRNSDRPMRVRAMRDNFRKIGRCFIFMGDDKILSKKFEYIKFLLKKGNKIKLVYEESVSSPPSIESHHAVIRLEFRTLLKKYDLNYSVFFRDMYQAYPAYEKILKEKAFSRFKTLRDEASSMLFHINTLYTPSETFEKEMYKRGMISKKYKNVLSSLPPAINNSCKIFHNDYIVGYEDTIKIVYTGGMGEFYDFSVFIQALLLCSHLPIEFYLHIKKGELDKSRHIYGYELDNAPNIFIRSGSFTELAINMNFDLGMSLFKDDPYRKMSVPVKVFDYLSLNIPVLSGIGTEAAKIVTQSDVGFSIENNIEEIVKFFIKITENRALLREKQKNIVKFIDSNSWECRVKEVLKDTDAF